MKRAPYVVAVALFGLCGCDIEDLGGFGRFNRDFHYSYPLNANGRVSVETFNGSIEISGWDQNTVDISGTKYGPSQSEADALNVSVDHAADSVDIRVVRPSIWRNNIGARFVLKVPRGAVVDRITASNGAIRITDGAGPAHLKTSNGHITIEGLHGDVDAHTSNGAIDLMDIEGDVQAHTSNGHIRAEGLNGSFDVSTSNGPVNAHLSKADRPVRAESSNGAIELWLAPNQSRDVRAHTSNSSITLHLSDPVNAHVSAHTSNSSINSNFGMTMSGELKKNQMDGAIGAGGPLFDLSTSNGPIRLLKM